MAGLAPAFGNSLTSSSGIPIGGSMYMSDRGPFLVFDDKSEWVRQNAAVAYSEKYSKANKFSALRVYGGNTSTVSGYTAFHANNVVSGRLVATDYNGTILVADAGISGTGNAIYRSTNGGTSWSAVSIALGTSFNVSSIVWAGNRFVLVAYNAISGWASFFHSTDGSSWTAGTANYTNGTSISPILICDPSTNIVIAVTGNATYAIQRSGTTGSTFSNPTTTFSVSLSPRIAGNSSKLVCTTAASSYRVSTDNGVTWGSALTTSTPSNYSYLGYVNGVFILQDNSNLYTYYYTTTPETYTSWIRKDFMEGGTYIPDTVGLNSQGVGFHNSNKTRLYLPTATGFYYTDDGYTWIHSWCTATYPVQPSTLPVDSGAGVAIFKGYPDATMTSLEYYYTPSLSIPNYLGNRIGTASDTKAEYIRIY